MTDFVDSHYEASALRPPPAPPLRGETRADVAVVGGGFCGLSCALESARRGRKTVLLEARQVGWGASGRNGGQFIYGYAAHDLPRIARAAGAPTRVLFDAARAAIDLLRARIDDFKIECDRRQGFLCAADKARQARELALERDLLEREFDYPTRLLDREQTRAAIASERFVAALEDRASGHLHPLKYALGLARAARESGVEICERSPARAIEKTATGFSIQTDGGVLRCSQLALCGNAYMEELRPRLRRRIMPVGTYIGATEPLGERARALIPGGHGVCDANFVIDYFRVADERLLFGGRVSYTARAPRDLARVMRARMLRTFPQLADVKIERAWGGNVAITQSRFPDIGRDSDGAHYAQGFSGHGVALSGFAGKLLADAMAGEAELFDVFARVKHRSFPGGRVLRAPILAAAMLYFRLRDLL